MQRFFGLVLFVLFAMPFGLSVVGCGHKTSIQYCTTNLEGGPQVGQVQTITLASNLTVTGESLNYGQIGSALSATAADCTGAAVTVTSYTYGTKDPSIADINPTNGQVCAGTWNRNSGGGIADYTVCTAPPASNTKHIAYIYAAANGATSNAIAVYIHAPVTAVQLGNASQDCNNDPATNCPTSNNLVCNANATAATQAATAAVNENACFSQGVQRLLVARVYDGSGNNITCQVGPVSFALQGSTNVATLDAQGFATANQPGSALVTATVSNSSSALNSGFVSTCPPRSIQLAAVNQPTNATSVNVGLNTSQSFTATVIDTLGNPITGLALEFNSTQPVNIPTSGGSVTPIFPGTASITAVCNPGSCNPAPFSQIGVNGNGNPITSNGITVTASGTSASVLYMASAPSTTTTNGQTVTNAGSQYVVSEDFTTGQLSTPIKLPFVPNSMVISQDGSTLYLGSSQGLMTITTASNTVASTFTTVQGTVLAVAPSNAYAVVTDPTRQTVSLVTSSGSVFSTYNGIGVRAAWTPDSNTLYVITQPSGGGGTSQLITYSTFTGWQTIPQVDESYTDVAVTVPAVGAYFAGARTEGRSYCASTVAETATAPPAATNYFAPLADTKAVQTDRLAATTDGKHILGASAATSSLVDFGVTLPTATACPQYPATVTSSYFSSTPTTHALTGLTAAAINNVVPASNSGTAFVTYTGTGGVLPVYQPSTGVVTNVPLSSGATAPVAGVYSSDDTTFYAGTSGDNQVHIIGVNGASSQETGLIKPSLQNSNGGIATPNLIAQHVRRTTS